MPIEPTNPTVISSVTPPDFIVIPGTGLRLFRVSVLHAPLRGLYPTLDSFLRYLDLKRVPVEWMGDPTPIPYINPFTFAVALQYDTRLRTPPSDPPPPVDQILRELFASQASFQPSDVPTLASQARAAAEKLAAASHHRAMLYLSRLPPAPAPPTPETSQ